MKVIGVLTSGGDSPGMNAAVRSIVRYAVDLGLEVIGVRKGYKGLIEGDFIALTERSVSGIIDKGGTMLLSAREPRFHKPEYRRLAYENLQKYEIEGLIVIGGDGSFRGAWDISRESGIPVIGITGTIDNDIGGTDYTLGYDTALNNAMQAIDKIRDTANSLERVFIIEVMGKNRGILALDIALATGSELALIPEIRVPIEEVAEKVAFYKRKGKLHVVIVLAEGFAKGHVFYEDLKEALRKHGDFDLKLTVLGHIQRGGSPTAKDRIMASLFGQKAVDALLAGENGKFVAVKGDKIELVPLNWAWEKQKEVDARLMKLLEHLAI